MESPTGPDSEGLSTSRLAPGLQDVGHQQLQRSPPPLILDAAMNPLSPSLLDAAAHTPVLVGFSGGLDSTVLLHLLAHAPARAPGTLRAVHIHHGLQAAADGWETHCRTLCLQWNIPLQVIRVEVPHDSGDGLEAAARKARHHAFMQTMQPGEWLALAHHLDDQAETFLLRALRGSGIDGLAAMRERRAFGPGNLWRPLLTTPRARLLEHAQHHGLQWIEDPSNQLAHHDRNFLRLQILPLLAARWPQAAHAFARSAALAAQTSVLLSAHDNSDLATCLTAADTLDLQPLNALPAPRRARLYRAWVQHLRLPPLPANGVHSIERHLLSARADLQPAFVWQGMQISRWRGQLHAFTVATPWPADWQARWDGAQPLTLPDGSRLLLSGATFDIPLQVRARQGGERIRLPGREHYHSLKQLLQESDIPPWQRAGLPLLWRDGELLAAGDRILSAPLQQWLQTRHTRLHWQQAPASN